MGKKSGGSHHVVPHGDGWAIKRSGGKRPSKVLPTKGPAVDRGREISRRQGTELVIHKRDGTIQRRDSHGNDPHPPKG